jgi:hypothetical protein
MAIVEFPFIPIPIGPTDPFPKGQVALRPMVFATLTAANGKTLRCIVCLDSGADSCVFPTTFASVLGLDILQMKKQLTGGVGTSANQTYYDNLEIDLGSGIKFNSYVGFIPGLDAQGIGLLGQSGFFNYYNVCFYQKKFKFTIETT